MNNLIKAIDSKLFNRHQRGFVKGGKTTENIINLLKFGQNCQKDLKSKAAIVFFDIKTAYDSVVRDILYSKMKEFKINDNIILTVKYMLDNFKLKFGRSIINTTRGLAQGSTLSPILFNIYYLLNLLEKSGILTLAFADDIAC